MSSQRIRITLFRYSLRTALFVAFFVACYFACARPTKTSGVRDLNNHLNPQEDLALQGTNTILSYFSRPPEASYVAPLVVRFPTMALMPGDYDVVVDGSYDHYLWLFGWIVRLPC